MSATIITVSGDKQIQLLNSQIIRRPIILNNWTTLRIGVRCKFPSAGNIVGTPAFHIGIGSGLVAGIGDASTTNWIGAAPTTATWTRNAGPPPYCSAVTTKVRKKVAAVVTDSASGTVSALLSMDQDTPNILIVEIIKGSPNYTVNVAGPASAAAAQTAATQTHLIQMLELAALGTVSSIITGYSSGGQALAMSEAAGNLDAIQIYWDRTSAPMEITEVFYRKVA